MAREKNHTTIDEIRVRPAMRGLLVSIGTTRRPPVNEGLSWRKRTGHASEQEREEVRKPRRAWKEVQAALSGRRVILFDETALFTNMMRRRGWSLIGKGCRIRPLQPSADHHADCRFGSGGIVAPMILDGSPDGAAFRVWVERMPVRDLRRGDVVVCDNLSVDRIAGIRDVIETAGVELRFLPPCSPDLNRIEKSFSQMKSHLGKAAANPKVKLRRATASAIDPAAPETAVKHCISCGHPCISTLLNLAQKQNPFKLDHQVIQNSCRGCTYFLKAIHPDWILLQESRSGEDSSAPAS